MIDEVTQFSWSTFGKKKSDLSDKVFTIILGIFNNGYKVKKFKQDYENIYPTIEKDNPKKTLLVKAKTEKKHIM